MCQTSGPFFLVSVYGTSGFRQVAVSSDLLEAGYNIREVQELLGHKSVETTMIYTHVMSKGADAVKSPLDILA